MKRKIILGACAALFLGIGAVAASHLSGNGLFGGLAKDDVESLAECEVYEGGVVVASCEGDAKDGCSIPYGGRTITCDGKRVK